MSTRNRVALYLPIFTAGALEGAFESNSSDPDCQSCARLQQGRGLHHRRRPGQHPDGCRPNCALDGNAALRWRSGKRAALPRDCRRINVSQLSQHSVRNLSRRQDPSRRQAGRCSPFAVSPVGEERPTARSPEGARLDCGGAYAHTVHATLACHGWCVGAGSVGDRLPVRKRANVHVVRQRFPGDMRNGWRWLVADADDRGTGSGEPPAEVRHLGRVSRREHDDVHLCLSASLAGASHGRAGGAQTALWEAGPRRWAEGPGACGITPAPLARR